jgi:hypothetical protein
VHKESSLGKAEKVDSIDLAATQVRIVHWMLRCLLVNAVATDTATLVLQAASLRQTATVSEPLMY